MNFQNDISAIVDEFGPPAYENAKGTLSTLNENFWAAYYARRRTKLIFEPDERQFFDYDPATGIFVRKSSDLIRTELSALIFDAAQSWDTAWFPLQHFRGAQALTSVITHLRGQCEARDFFDSPAHFVHLGDCSLKFSSDGSSHTREKFSPEHRARNRSPINFDPAATCPEFKKHMLGHVRDDDALLLQKAAGQALLGRNITQRFFILDGPGASSKSSFVLTLAGIVGQKSVYELRTKLLDTRFEIGRMIGRTLLVGSDVQGDFLSHEGAHRIKALVGGDPLEAEQKKSNHLFSVKGEFNVMVISNTRQRTRIDGDRKAWERRMAIVRYEKPYSGKRILEIDKYLLEKESAGILNWAISGLSLLFADYAAAGDIILSPTQKTRVSDLLSESDSLHLFVQNEITHDTTPMSNGVSFSLTTDEIIAAYIRDCVDYKHWTPTPVAQVEKDLPDLMLKYFGVSKSHDLPRNGKHKRGFWNVRF
jgi:P4 family phage/plasmid primase-like protien